MRHFRDQQTKKLLLVLLTTLAILAASCSSETSTEEAVADTESAESTAAPTPDSSSSEEPPDNDEDESDDETSSEETAADTGEVPAAADLPDSLASDWLGSYERVDEDFGTMVTVTVADGIRTVVSNALPDHDTGEFPNDGNPNAIEAQSLSWTYAETGVNTGNATAVRTTGVAINGVKFEPGTGESVTCESGESYRIEAIQDLYDLGLDFNNAHVQPGGEYHYHGISSLLVEIYDNDNDLVHIGFAADGNLIYYSKSGAYSSSYVLADGTRTGSDCVATGPDQPTFDIEGSAIDGTYTSDWNFTADAGDLDECNGVTIDGQYIYLATETYPFVGRCVMGEAVGDGVGGAGAPGSGTDGDSPDDAPDLGEAAAALGVSEADLVAALGSPPDLNAAADTLGISVDEIAAVLPAPPS